MKDKKQKAFTLIELLVVLAIFGLLASIILVAVRGARDKAKIAATLQFSASVRHALGAYIIGEFKFEGNANDSSGTPGTSVINQGVTFVPNDASAQMGQAGNFNGSAYIRASNPAILTSLKDFTYSVWVKPNDLLGWRTIIDIDDDVQLLALDSGAVAIYRRCDYIRFDSVSAGTWYHLVWTVLGSNYKVYLNGKEIGSGSGCSSSISGSNIMVGAGLGPNELFNGLIDEAQVYNTSLSLTQVQQLYAEGLEKHKNLANK
jgi:prepilin-type N-terminal cleavage/methylation domain-containing protein